MTLKEMIEEARMMAETPDLDNIRSSPETTVQDSELSSRKSSISQGIRCSYVGRIECLFFKGQIIFYLSNFDYHYSSAGPERSRMAKSPSEHSVTDSVISVIERPMKNISPSLPGKIFCSI